jgi:hypothetical protein
MNRPKPLQPRRLWRLRYRLYAFLMVIVATLAVFSSTNNAPESVDIFGVDYTWQNILVKKVGSTLQQVATGTGATENLTPEQIKKIEQDKLGLQLTKDLKKAGYDLGTISSQAFLDLNIELPVTVNYAEQPSDPNQKTQTLDDLIPRPANPTRFSFLSYPDYKVNAPIVYTSFQDLFATAPDGQLDFNSPLSQNSTDSPVQMKLRDGIVHLAFTPQPGEIGNSYIIGHSSNFSYVKSSYNTIFKPLEKRTKPGETFIIYDRFGRELVFEVFETKAIQAEDTNEAYKIFGPNDRVVTLQTSILELKDGKFQPTKRWLTRGILKV